MSSKLYFIQDIPYYTPPAAWAGGWDEVGTSPGLDGDPFPLQVIDPDKYGTGQGTMFGFKSSIPATPYKKGICRFVSRPLLPQTISGTVDGLFGVRETNVAHDLYTRVHIVVMNCTTNTVHGTLLNGYEESTGGGGTEWGTSSTVPGRAFQAVQALTSVTVPSDANVYRMIVEFGYICRAVIGTSPDGRINIGARTGVNGALKPDQALGVTPASQKAGFLEFSADITFGPHPFPNVGPETATVMTLPFSLTVDPLKAGGTWGKDYTNAGGLWYKYTASADQVLAIICTNAEPQDANLHLYHEITPGVTVPLQEDWQSTQVPSTQYKRIQYWILATGETIYLRIYINYYTAGNAIKLAVQASAPPSAVQAGDLLINADDDGVNNYDPTMSGAYPTVYYGQDGTLRHVSGKFPGGELGASLASGRFGLAGKRFPQWQRRLWIFDAAPSLVKLFEPDLPGSGSQIIVALGTDFTSFYAALAPHFTSNGPSTVYKISADGVVSGTTYGPLPVFPVGLIQGGSNASMGVSRDGTILYYGHTQAGGVVKRHDLVGNTVLSDLAPTLVGGLHRPGDIIVLKDGTIAVAWDYQGVPISQKILHYAADGTVLHTIDYGASFDRIHHITYDTTDSATKIWVWLQHGSATVADGTLLRKNYFRLVNLVTGVTEKTIEQHAMDPYGLGQYSIDPATITEWFVAANSCPLTMMMGGGEPDPGPMVHISQLPIELATLPPDLSGIYFLNPAKRHDSYYGGVEKKIPNPTIKTALIGE